MKIENENVIRNYPCHGCGHIYYAEHTDIVEKMRKKFEEESKKVSTTE